MIEEITEKHRNRCERLAEERYDALRNTIKHLYGKKFLFELEMNVSRIIRGSRYENTIPDRLSLLRRQYRNKCKIDIPYQIIRKAAYREVYEDFKTKHKYNEPRDLWLIRKRSKVRQRYNRLAEVIRRDFGETMQNELILQSKTLALAEIIQKSKCQKFSYSKGYSENDLSFALRHLRILYAYNKRLSEGEYGTNIHAKINGNYKDCMLDYYKNK